MSDDAPSPPSPQDDEALGPAGGEAVGQTPGRYKLRERIGEGGYGVVYVAEQEEPIRRRVALKVIKLGMDTRSVIARFDAERQALARMDHPNIAKVLDAGSTDAGRPYFVMELVRGIRITDYCDQHNLSTRQRLELFIPVCHAIQHAHQKGIIHRDLKPSNILVTLHDGVPVPKVIDFGIAKATEGRLTDATVYTQLNQFIGTPAYMSPEQAEMSGLDVDTRADLYSLGVVLYELLTGRTPFEGKELAAAGIEAMRWRIRETEPPRPSTRLASLKEQELTWAAKHRSAEAPKLISLLRGDLDWIVMKCLEKDRTRRYETANGLALDIQRHLNNEPVVARPPTAAYKVTKFVRRNRVMVGAAGLVAAALVLGVLVSTWQAVRANQARRQADAEAVRAQQAEKTATDKSVVAETQRQRAEAYLYSADMVLAQHALEAKNLGRVGELLQKYCPPVTNSSASGSQPFKDLRGWEWRHIWARSRSDELYTLGAHRGIVDFAVFSDDGVVLATSSQDKSVKTWDMESRREIAAINFPAQPWDLCFAPKSRTVVVAVSNEVVFLDALSGRRTGVIPYETNVWSVAFSRDGNRLAVHQGTALHMLDARSQRELWKTAVAGAWRLTFSPDDALLAAALQNSRVLLIDPVNGSQLASLPGFPGSYFGSLVFSPDAALLACASADTGPTVRVYDAKMRRELRVLELQEGRWFGGIAFSPDGKIMAVSGGPHVITLVDRHTWQVAGHLQGHLDEVWALAFSPDGKTLVSTSKDTTVRAWRAELRPRKRFDDRRLELPSDVDACALSSDGSKLCALTTNHTFVVWDTATQRELTRGSIPFTNIIHTAASGWTRPWALSCDGRRLFSPTRTGRVIIWDTETRESLATLETKAAKPWALALSPDEKTLAVAGADGFVWLWDLPRQALLTNLPLGPSRTFALTFSAGNRLLGVGYDEGEVEAWELPGLRKLLSGHSHTLLVHALAISPDHRLLAAASPDARVSLWDLEKGMLIKVFRGALNSYNCVTISRDSRRVFAGGGPGTLSVWDTDTLQSVGTFEGHRLGMRGLVVLSGTDDVVSVGSDAVGQYNLHLWRAPSWAEIEAAEKDRAQER